MVVALFASDFEADAQTTFQMFGHLEAVAEQDGDENYSGFSIGEHDLFVTSQLTDLVSFLSEMVIKPRAPMSSKPPFTNTL